MKVLLINPKTVLPIEVRTSPPLGIAYIAAVSEKAGHEVRLFDMQVEDAPVQQVVREFNPDIVGITATTSLIKPAWVAAVAVKEISSCPVVLGGVHATILPDETLSRPEVDVVVRGEGEDTWVELCERIESWRSSRGRAGFKPAPTPVSAAERLGSVPTVGAGFKPALTNAPVPRDAVEANDGDRGGLADALGDMPGISFRDASGKIRRNPDRPLIQDLDRLPFPAYHLFKMDRYTSLQPILDHTGANVRSLSLMTSRGCPYRCIYCSQSVYPDKWRARSPESVIAEWRYLVKDLGATEIGVLDDSFNIDRKRVLAICQGLVAEGLNRVPWLLINGIRANLADRELLGAMKEAGCKRVAFGVESGSQRVLDSIDKKLTIEEVRRAFRAAKEVGLETIGFFMIGLPEDSEETIEDTIRLAIELDPVVANFSMATPFPGTKLHDQVSATGKLLMQDWDDYVFFEGKARYEMGGLPVEVAERKWHEAYRRFYMRPSRVLQTLARKSTWLDLPRTVKMAMRLALKRG